MLMPITLMTMCLSLCVCVCVCVCADSISSSTVCMCIDALKAVLCYSQGVACSDLTMFVAYHVQVVDAENLTPVADIHQKPVLVAIAAFFPAK